jgi:hypothetical protein
MTTFELGLVLHVDRYLGGDPDDYLDPRWGQLDPAVYHGGNAWEDLAALLL